MTMHDHVTGYRDAAAARGLAARIAEAVRPGTSYRFMEFCGGHTHVLARWGLSGLLPPGIRMIHGPGCPVCVLPVSRIDMAVGLALEHDVTLCTYADLMRVPASGGRSLLRARAEGADVRMVASPLDALEAARADPSREVVFLAIGFETTAPATAAVVKRAVREGVGNFSVLCCHVLTPPAVEHVLAGGVRLDGIVGPAHVSVITGEAPWREIAGRHRIGCVICGFEPLDMLLSILMLVQQVNAGTPGFGNEFVRAVTAEGNPVARALLEEVFVVRPAFAWRGLGVLERSALALAPAFSGLDAERRFGLVERAVPENRACACGAILRGEKTPRDCRLFGRACTPAHPVGACMVSGEGACAAEWSYGERERREEHHEPA